MDQINYKALIVGAGDIGAGYDTPSSDQYLTYAHAFKDHSGFSLIGFVETNEKKGLVASKKWQVNFFRSISCAFDNFKIDVVSIAVPDESHYQILKEVAKYQPKFVIAEKPLTQTISQAKEIANLYKKIPSFVNFKRRFTPEIISLKHKIKNNEFGEFRFGTAYYGKGFIHNGSHLLNLLVFLLEIKWDHFEIIDTIIDYKEDDPSVSVLLKTKGNDLSFLIKSIDQNEFTVFDFEMIFSKGKIRITDLGVEIEEYQIDQNDTFSNFSTLKLKKRYKTSLNRSMIFMVDNVHKILTQEAPIPCKFNEIYKEMELAQKIINSIKR